MKSWLEKNTLEMYATHNEGYSVSAEKFVRTLKSKIYKYMTSVSKYVCTNKIDDIVNKYNNKYHSRIKMKLVNVKPSTYTNSSKEINDKDSTFKIGDIVRTSTYKKKNCKRLCPKLVQKGFCEAKS